MAVNTCMDTVDTRFFSCLASGGKSEEGRQLQCSEKLALPAPSLLVWTLWWIWPLCGGRGQPWNTRLCGEFGHFFVGLWLGQSLGTFQTQPSDPTLDARPRPGEISSSTVRGTCFNVPRTIPALSFGHWATRVVGAPTSPPARRPYGVGIPNDDRCNMKERNTMEMPCSFVVMGKAGCFWIDEWLGVRGGLRMFQDWCSSLAWVQNVKVLFRTGPSSDIICPMSLYCIELAKVLVKIIDVIGCGGRLHHKPPWEPSHSVCFGT